MLSVRPNPIKIYLVADQENIKNTESYYDNPNQCVSGEIYYYFDIDVAMQDGLAIGRECIILEYQVSEECANQFEYQNNNVDISCSMFSSIQKISLNADNYIGYWRFIYSQDVDGIISEYVPHERKEEKIYLEKQFRYLHAVHEMALPSAMALVRSLERDYSYLINDKTATLMKYMVEFVVHQEPFSMDGMLTKAIAMAPYIAQQRFFNVTIMPSYDELVLLRKFLIKEKIKQSIQHDDIQQILFVGHGYDVRSLITALENPDIEVFELDNGAVRELKVKALQSLPDGLLAKPLVIRHFPSGVIEVNANFHLVEGDYHLPDWHDALIMNGFDLSKRTLVIAEGLLNLSVKENESVLQSIYALVYKQEDEVLLSYMTDMQYSMMRRLARDKNDKYNFSLHRDKVISFLHDYGFSPSAKLSSCNLLSELGDMNGKAYYSDKRQPREIFYVIKRTEYVDELIIDLDQVPDMEISLPNKAEENCLVM